MTRTQNVIGDKLLLPETNYSDLMGMDSFPDNLCVLFHKFNSDSDYNDALRNGIWKDMPEVEFELPSIKEADVIFNKALCIIANTKLITIENSIYRHTYPLTFVQYEKYFKTLPKDHGVLLWNLIYGIHAKLYHQRC